MLTQADSSAIVAPFTPPPSTAAAIGGNVFASSSVLPLIDGDAGYMLVSATGRPPQGQSLPLSLDINMQMGAGGDNASSGDDDSDHFDGVERIPSSTCLLGESAM